MREADAELAARASVPEVARKLIVSEATFHLCSTQYRGVKSDEMKRLRELEKENARLKKLLAERDLEIEVMKEINAKTW